MSNCYLCDICACKECDLAIDRCTCRHRGETYKIVWMDNDDRPPQMICDYYVSHSMAEIYRAFDKAAAMYTNTLDLLADS